jgi:hypothetical protein
MGDNEGKSKGLWAKAYHSILDDEKLISIKMQPNGIFTALIFHELIILASKINRFGRFMVTSTKPMDVNQMAYQLRQMDLSKFNTAIDMLIDYEILAIDSTGCLFFVKWEEYQSVDHAEKKREYDRKYQNKKRESKTKSEFETKGQTTLSDFVDNSIPNSVENFNPQGVDNFQNDGPFKKKTDKTSLVDNTESTHENGGVSLENRTDVVNKSYENRSEIVPIDKDTDIDIDIEKDYYMLEGSPDNTSSSFFEFSKDEEKLIEQYVEAKWRNGKITETKEGYRYGVEQRAIKNKKEFEGMKRYVELDNNKKKSKQSQDEVKESLKSLKLIDEKRDKLKKEILKQIKESKLKDEIESKAIERIKKSVPNMDPKRIMTPWLHVEMIDLYKEHLLEEQVPNHNEEVTWTPDDSSFLRELDKKYFILDFASVHKMEVSRVEELLKENKIEPFHNYSSMYTGKDAALSLLEMYSGQEWLKNAKNN